MSGVSGPRSSKDVMESPRDSPRGAGDWLVARCVASLRARAGADMAEGPLADGEHVAVFEVRAPRGVRKAGAAGRRPVVAGHGIRRRCGAAERSEFRVNAGTVLQVVVCPDGFVPIAGSAGSTSVLKNSPPHRGESMARRSVSHSRYPIASSCRRVFSSIVVLEPRRPCISSRTVSSAALSPDASSARSSERSLRSRRSVRRSYRNSL